MNENIIGIIDEPVAPGSNDNLDIDIHADSLIKFIDNTNTPITIGIQGEWGSGKTSLLNSIFHSFENNEQCKQIWINSWEYSLLSTPEESLLKIVNRIIDDLLEADKNQKRKEKIQNGAKKIFQGALRVGAQLTLGNEAANVAGELLASGDASIGVLRNQLTELVNEIERRDSNPYKKILIYVDDLDRIEPKNAVAILELLKNIFSVPNCVFILAIDYQVVVKGLEGKFGKQTAENEWEFRAFFDKIIQLPFMMPMGQYNIGKYVNSLLKDIGFVGNDGLDEDAVKKIVLSTIGGNPRSIKRLVNSVSLIQIFTEVKSEKNNQEVKEEIISEDQVKFLLFSLLCLQIAYPGIYSLLNIRPNFVSWDEDFAFSETKKKEESEAEFETEFNNAQQTDDFNEEWEKSLFRICYTRPRLKVRVSDISKFFSYIKDELLEDKPEIIGEIISEILTQTSVTSVSSTDQAQPVPEVGRFQRTMYSGFDDWKSQVLAKFGDKKPPERVISQLETSKFLHDKVFEILENEEIEMKYSKTGGCTCYATKNRSKKFLAISLREGVVSLELLKDYKNDYKVPNLSKLKTGHIRQYDPTKPSTAAFNEQYYIRLGSVDDIDEYMNALSALVKRSFEIAQNEIEKILPIYEGTDDIEQIKKQEVLFDDAYRYEV